MASNIDRFYVSVPSFSPRPAVQVSKLSRVYASIPLQVVTHSYNMQCMPMVFYQHHILLMIKGSEIIGINSQNNRSMGIEGHRLRIPPVTYCNKLPHLIPYCIETVFDILLSYPGHMARAPHFVNLITRLPKPWSVPFWESRRHPHWNDGQRDVPVWIVTGLGLPRENHVSEHSKLHTGALLHLCDDDLHDMDKWI